MNVQGIIFDLDGVIVSTDHYHYLGWKKIADEEGIAFNETINNRLRGVSRMESLAIILERADKSYSEEEKVALASKKNGYYVEYLSDLNASHILDGVQELLPGLKERNIKIAIGSSSRNAKLILEKIGLLHSFDAIADGSEIKNSKPDPEVFLLAAQKMGLEPAQCAVVEDAISGIDAANAANMISIAVSDAKTYDKAAYRLDGVEELLLLLG
ncbi:beta-phosphoglucomutase [Paenibacillus sp. OV219]|uniref:beta-phosphoglucomutase n=1 Tax=Paenibacillus sp. OV219 TaxID=1884377 RepID=UPI0008AFC525|nr:beta-phosphoglucomutase [Paenibacillus sp. OV219]SEO12626.1 beta-phosphoglucomutase [Paenibacillus sp. OV219]